MQVCVCGGGLVGFFSFCLPLTQKPAGKAQRHPTLSVLENSGTQMEVCTNFAILDWRIQNLGCTHALVSPVVSTGLYLVLKLFQGRIQSFCL